MQPDITEDVVLEISKEVIALVRKHTTDVSTGKAILSAARDAFGGGFSQHAQLRLEGSLSPSEHASSLQESLLRA